METRTLVPVITLWQPYASLIFTGDKVHETRSFCFPEKYLGRRVAIHSALALPKPADVHPGLNLLCEEHWTADWRDRVRRGLLLGTVEIVDCVRTTDCQPDHVDRICGDWSPGRFAWRLRNPKLLTDQLSAKGKQGWWSIEARLLGDGHA